jgi:hypothetical protein
LQGQGTGRGIHGCHGVLFNLPLIEAPIPDKSSRERD